MKTFTAPALIALLGLSPVSTFAATEATTTAAVTAPGVAASYKLGVADKIRVTVYNEPTLSGEFLVNFDGSVALPLIGNMTAAGLAAPELQAILESKFADGGYLRAPRVVVEVLTYRPFYIYGYVMKPGQYPYSEGLSVMKAIALAEGFTGRANRGKIFITRPGGKETRVETDRPVQPGDLIRVPGRNF